MKCIDPVLCYTLGKGKKIYRHFSIVRKFSPWRLDLPHLVFNCLKCVVCRRKQCFLLASRCVLHASMYRENSFITLTYDEKKPTYHNTFEYPDIQKFKKSLRQHVWRKYKRRIEIFNVHEYGKRGKKHWHLLVFGFDPPHDEIVSRKNNIPLYSSKTLAKLWPMGFSSVGDVSLGSAMYQAQYMEKDLKNGNLMSQRKSHSKHSGIGRPWFMANYKQILMLGYIPMGGRKVPLPRYFEKLAHKHYCHYYDPRAFFDVRERKALYRPFKKEEPNKEIADLFVDYKRRKEELVLTFEKEWNDILSTYLVDKKDPDFVKAGSNILYDLKNKQPTGVL